ncbi:MAG: hypothetical protein GWP19_00365 [Planctomycetia bacterium]|nr:hypothetical protein [Planctomycetia bacterium]
MNEKPIIWKKTDCLVGECKDLHNQHWESLPFSTPMGLVTECYHCKKTKYIKLKKKSNFEEDYKKWRQNRA